MEDKKQEGIKSTCNSESGVERVVMRVRIGMRVVIKNNAMVGNDCKFGKWKNEGEVFIIDSRLFSHKDRYVLRGDGWGNKDNYGNGVVFANKADLLHA